MLEPRETDIPALFLVLVVLPLLAYILLGKWSEASKKKERICLLAQLAAEEAFRAEAMAAAMATATTTTTTMPAATVSATATATATATAMPMATIVPHVSLSKNGIHECARCHGPATTRCARCKSVRYWYGQFLNFGCKNTFDLSTCIKDSK